MALRESMTTRVVLGLDPGPRLTGYGVLFSAGGTAQPKYLRAGVVESKGAEIVDLIRYWIGQGYTAPFYVAVETPAGYIHEAARASALLETAKVAGMIAEAARGLGVDVVSIPAARWRLTLCGKNNPKDATVKRAISVVVSGLPKRTNVHERDALGCAYAALQMQFGARVAPTGT